MWTYLGGDCPGPACVCIPPSSGGTFEGELIAMPCIQESNPIDPL